MFLRPLLGSRTVNIQHQSRYLVRLLAPSPVHAGVQIDRLQKAADDARHQLESKENIVKELSRDGSKLDKERYAVLSSVL